MSDGRKKFVEENFNVIGICGDAQSIGRLIGMHEDALDYYYRIKMIGGKEILWSAVGWFIPLNGAIPEDAYKFLEHVFSINKADASDAPVYSEVEYEENVSMYGEMTADEWLRRKKEEV